MILNGPKWYTKIDHKFNRMVFITRFNLVLVWSKIVKILTKSHPNESGIARSPGLVHLVSHFSVKQIITRPGDLVMPDPF